MSDYNNISNISCYDGRVDITTHDLVYYHTEEEFIASDPCDTMRVCFICFHIKEIGTSLDGAMFTCNKCLQARKKTFASIRDLGDLGDGINLRDKLRLVESLGYID